MGRSACVIASFRSAVPYRPFLSRVYALDRSQFAWLRQTIGWCGLVDRGVPKVRPRCHGLPTALAGVRRRGGGLGLCGSD